MPNRPIVLLYRPNLKKLVGVVLAIVIIVIFISPINNIRIKCFPIMNNIWNKVYSDYSSFFGDQPSKFALMCYEKFVNHKVQKVLELGCGQGRDSLFFASKGLDVTAIDSSEVAIENLRIKAKEMNIDIKLKNISALEGLTYPDNYFDVVYSHMFYNMGFTDNELKLLFSESNRVLKNKGLLSFSVRSDKDIMYNKGTK